MQPLTFHQPTCERPIFFKPKDRFVFFTLFLDGNQLGLGNILKEPVPEQEVPTEKITYERKKKQRPDDSVTDQGLRFNDNVPVELIHLSAPEMQGEDADQYEIIDHKDTYRLAQRPGSYVILQYQRDVVRHKLSQTLTTVAAPSGLFDRSFADVSFIAGMLVDKYLYHLPLYQATPATGSQRYYSQSWHPD